MTLFADTRTFRYAIEVKDLAKLDHDLRDQYDELIDFAAGHNDDAKLDRPSQNALLKSLAGSWETIDAIDEAIASLDAMQSCPRASYDYRTDYLGALDDRV